MRGAARSGVRSIVVLALVAGAWITAAPPAFAATLVVNTTDDTTDGQCTPSNCTLREAILAANVTAAKDNIDFALSSATPVISVGSSGGTPLPAITHPVVIDGTSGASTRVELEGSNAGTGTSAVGLEVSGGGSTIKGLAIDGFDGDGIKVDSGGNTVVGCRIGTNADGTAAAPNGRQGIEINGAFAQGVGGNVIGGTTAAARNLLSGNGLTGIFVIGSNGNVIEGNRIGTNAAGTAAIANTVHGLEIFGAKSNVVGGTAAGAGNLISGNAVDGIFVEDSFNSTSTAGTVIQGNRIGTNAAGTAALGNDEHGIALNDFPTHTLIGGSTPEARNLISGNHADGINVSVNQVTAKETIQGNYIGTDVTGTLALGNTEDGIDLNGARSVMVGGSGAGEGNVIAANHRDGVRIENSFGFGFEARNNVIRGNRIGTNAAGTAALGNLIGVHVISQLDTTIGGASTGAGNLISGNAIGVHIDQGATGTVVQGNLIGTDVTGKNPVPNESDGVVVNGTQNDIGGTARGAGNVIAFNGPSIVGGNGVLVKNATAATIEGNSIFSNSILGIDLGDNGVTPNDPGDADVGDNDLQNFPSVKSAKSNATVTHVIGRLSSEPDVSFVVELFSSPTCDDSGNGQGQRFLGRTTVATASDGLGAFDVTFHVATKVGDRVTATATSPGGATSEFSACRKVVSGS